MSSLPRIDNSETQMIIFLEYKPNITDLISFMQDKNKLPSEKAFSRILLNTWFYFRAWCPYICTPFSWFSGQVAQLVEQRTENPCVGGSIPSLSTTLTYFCQ